MYHLIKGGSMDKIALEQYHSRIMVIEALEEILTNHINRTKDFKETVAIKNCTNTIHEALNSEKSAIKEIEKAIEQVKDPLYKSLLYSRYIKKNNLDKVAEDHHYSYEHTCKLIKQALEEIQ